MSATKSEETVKKKKKPVVSKENNGDEENDEIASLLEKSDRINKDGRHGGDIQGIINNLDYIEDMGFTQLWLNPVLENNQADYSLSWVFNN